jgi:hypothetical protein
MNISPDWDELDKNLDSDLSPDELNVYWTNESKNWLKALICHYGSDYRIEESENFFIVSNESNRYIELFSNYIERTLKRIMFTLKGIASDEGYGKHVVIIFKCSEDYYNYLEVMIPEGVDIGFSSGTFINNGYGHFVFPSQNIEISEPIAVHELTHSCLAHLPIPLWLNEGLAVLMEELLAGQDFYFDTEILNEHKSYWNNETIQGFWSGESFHSNDESQELSYHLAHLIVRNISKNYSSFTKFVNLANFEDAGDKIALECFGFTLDEIVGSFLGGGDWGPKDCK